MMPSDESRLRRQAISELLCYVVSHANDAETIGRRALILAYLCGHSDCPSQKHLAQKLGISEARVSVAVKKLRQLMADIARYSANPR